MEKLVNYILFSGKKRQSQNCFLKLVKTLQKSLDKNFTSVLKLSFVFLVPFFKINSSSAKNKHKKATFLVLHKNKSKVFLAIKLLVQTIKNDKSAHFFKKLYKEIRSILEKKSSIADTKKVLQSEVLLKKHIFFYFRWR